MRMEELAKKHGCRAVQLAFAWVLLGDDMVPIPEEDKPRTEDEDPDVDGCPPRPKRAGAQAFISTQDGARCVWHWLKGRNKRVLEHIGNRAALSRAQCPMARQHRVSRTTRRRFGRGLGLRKVGALKPFFTCTKTPGGVRT
ncbi:hypothetical protein Vadar_000347 [Vaccinium darrowii]|uniref:Uncharacterized protein n=1 Tax=Vaccinium darrowii TaxID=229202 RepID=A0ACB7ZHL5_9ERIC|nr:hypothetical protein Vadar_000347 [Vaccinium darrowii]